MPTQQLPEMAQRRALRGPTEMLAPPAPLERPAGKMASGEITTVTKGETVGLTPALTALAMRAARVQAVSRKGERDISKIVAIVMTTTVLILLVVIALR